MVLADLYPDNNDGRSPNAMAFRLLSGAVVTIITSKTSGIKLVTTPIEYQIVFPQIDIVSNLIISLLLAFFVGDLVTKLTDYHKEKVFSV